MTSLATPEEVSRSMATAESHIEAQQYRLVLPVMERYLFNTTLGADWYTELVNDLTDTANASRYSDLTTYTTGDLVIYYEHVYRALQDARSRTPNLTEYWERVQKFQTPANEEMYWGYLLPVIALFASSPASAMTAIQNSNIGLVRRNSETAQPANLSEIIAYRQDLDRLTRVALLNLHRYLTERPDQFPQYLGNAQPQRRIIPNKYYGFNFS